MTVEAIIFLTIFIMFYLFFIYLVQMSKAQIVLQYSINEVAKEVSAYSYVLTKTGMVEKVSKTQGSGNKLKADSEEVVDTFKKLCETLTADNLELDKVKDAGIDVKDKSKDYLKTYASDPKALFTKLVDLVKSGIQDKISEEIIGEIVKGEVEKQVANMSHKDADRYLKDLGVQDGLEGLDFSGTKWAYKESSDDKMPMLIVTVKYTMKIDLGWFELEPRKFKLSAKTAIW